MYMEHLAANMLWVTGLVLPLLLFFVGNKFRTTAITSVRALLAIAGGWAFLLAYCIVAGDPENGAALAFASVLGWVYPAIIVGFFWFCRWFLVTRRSTTLTHPSSGTR